MMARLGSVITERASDVDGSALAPDITSHSGATFYLHFESGWKEVGSAPNPDSGPPRGIWPTATMRPKCLFPS